ncbi:hypothetical protein IFM89_011272 [Coptis chinensis]|uniref:Disease resistance protein winged helix domain-containing protein n=1 Tax=Coptis chinensis TaxID=261450 RepID=A0A835HGH8_9MAGN|nr:hypothetical protein IFM89_011272 [Coptis chinensis]
MVRSGKKGRLGNIKRVKKRWTIRRVPKRCYKSCFLYLGLFTEDYEINVHKLISLWVAEGFVQSRRDEKIQDVAEDYLEDYIQRSMLQLALKLFGCYF